ncbi:MAG TPA: DUF2071 domain-containing protein, partial [Chitinophagaceae bacterium]|nr:DUF2071 domain-containing protein [Chitinophagaceae bacterium]
MLSFLKNHPFAVEAFFESSIVLTFAVPKEQLEKFIPGCLQSDTLNNKFAFIAVAMVKTKSLRPKGFPAFMGNNFFLTGYRIFVTFTNNKGKRLRGLYILKSETNKKKMEYLGNIFTHYNYNTINICQNQKGNEKEITSNQSGFFVKIKTGDNDISLPPQSPFTDWKEARKFAGPLPFTFTYNHTKKEVLIIEGVRQNWKPQPVKVLDFH